MQNNSYEKENLKLFWIKGLRQNSWLKDNNSRFFGKWEYMGIWLHVCVVLQFQNLNQTSFNIKNANLVKKLNNCINDDDHWYKCFTSTFGRTQTYLN